MCAVAVGAECNQVVRAVIAENAAFLSVMNIADCALRLCAILCLPAIPTSCDLLKNPTLKEDLKKP
jgi:hypothetical protein